MASIYNEYDTEIPRVLCADASPSYLFVTRDTGYI